MEMPGDLRAALRASMLLDAIAQLTGFDRAMLYRFLPAWPGPIAR